MKVEIDGEALRDEIFAVYGVELSAELFRGAAGDAARVALADRLAGAILNAGPRPAVPPLDRDRATITGWTPVPTTPVWPSRPGDPALATARLLAWARAGGA